MIEKLENLLISWGWNHWAVNHVRHWQTTILGVATLLFTIGNELVHVASTDYTPTVADTHAMWNGIVLAMLALITKQKGTHDVAIDETTGKPIPRAEEVK